MKKLLKNLFLWFIGGSIYYLIEIMYRGYSHWTMFILGGLCFVACDLINEIWEWSMPLIKQMFIGGMIITILEFITGYIVNIKLGWNVWNYSNPFNFMGQISLPSSIAWFFLAGVAIVLSDEIRYLFFNEEKPRYTIF